MSQVEVRNGNGQIGKFEVNLYVLSFLIASGVGSPYPFELLIHANALDAARADIVKSENYPTDKSHDDK